MGQVKTTYIKSLANDLIEKYPDKFTDNFEKNKEVVDELVVLESKKIRNSIAGYLVRLKKGEGKTFEAPVQKRQSRRKRRKRRK